MEKFYEFELNWWNVRKQDLKMLQKLILQIFLYILSKGGTVKEEKAIPVNFNS